MGKDTISKFQTQLHFDVILFAQLISMYPTQESMDFATFAGGRFRGIGHIFLKYYPLLLLKQANISLQI